jgi:hypothetical protein
MLFKEITPVYTKKHARSIKTKCKVTDCWSMCYVPMRFIRLNYNNGVYFREYGFVSIKKHKCPQTSCELYNKHSPLQMLWTTCPFTMMLEMGTRRSRVHSEFRRIQFALLSAVTNSKLCVYVRNAKHAAWFGSHVRRYGAPAPPYVVIASKMEIPPVGDKIKMWIPTAVPVSWRRQHTLPGLSTPASCQNLSRRQDNIQDPPSSSMIVSQKVSVFTGM